METITKGCLSSSDKIVKGCSFHQEGDTVQDDDGYTVRVAFDHELCYYICFDDFCNNEPFIDPDLNPFEIL